MKATNILCCAACAAALAASADDTTNVTVVVTADFSKTVAKFRPALHSSGYAPAFARAHQAKWDERIKEMNFEYVRTHDLALVNAGSRVLSFEKNLEPVPVDMNDGVFTLVKPDAYSAAFLLTFEF